MVLKWGLEAKSSGRLRGQKVYSRGILGLWGRNERSDTNNYRNGYTSLYSKGMTTRDIEEILSEMYGFEVSPSLISKITDRLLPEIEEWRSRLLKIGEVFFDLDRLYFL